MATGSSRTVVIATSSASEIDSASRHAALVLSSRYFSYLSAAVVAAAMASAVTIEEYFLQHTCILMKC